MKQFTKEFRNELLALSDISEEILKMEPNDYQLLEIANGIIPPHKPKIIEVINNLLQLNDNNPNKVLEILDTKLPYSWNKYLPMRWQFDETPLDLFLKYTLLLNHLINTFIVNLYSNIDFIRYDEDKPFKFSELFLNLLEIHFKDGNDSIQESKVVEFITSAFKLIDKEFYDRFITSYATQAEFVKQYNNSNRDMYEWGDFHCHKVNSELLHEDNTEFIKYIINNNCSACYYKLVERAFNVIKGKLDDHKPKLMTTIIDNLTPEFFNSHNNAGRLPEALYNRLIRSLTLYIGAEENPVLDSLRFFVPETITSKAMFERVIKSIEHNLQYKGFPNILVRVMDVLKCTDLTSTKHIDISALNLLRKFESNPNISLFALFEVSAGSWLEYSNKLPSVTCSLYTEKVLENMAKISFKYILDLEEKYPEMFKGETN